MVAAETLFGYMGLVFAYFIFLSVVPEVSEIYAFRAVGAVSVVPYVSMMVNSGVWSIYGPYTGEWILFFTNFGGFVLGLIYTVVYMHCATPGSVARATTVRMLVLGLVFLSIVGLFVASGFPTTSVTQTESWLGCLGDVCQVFLFGSPLALAQRVVQTKSTEGMPLPMSVAIFLCALTWMVYAALVGDMWVLIPNAMGVCLSAAQLVLFFIYDKPKEGSYFGVSHYFGVTHSSVEIVSLLAHPDKRETESVPSRSAEEVAEEGDTDYSAAGSAVADDSSEPGSAVVDDSAEVPLLRAAQ